MASASFLLRPNRSRPALYAQQWICPACSSTALAQQVRTKVLLKIARNRILPKSKRKPTKVQHSVPHQGAAKRLKELREKLKADYRAAIPEELLASYKDRPSHERQLDAGEVPERSKRVVSRHDRTRKRWLGMIKKTARSGRGELSALRRRLGAAPDQAPAGQVSREEAVRRYTERKLAEAGLPPLAAQPRRRDFRSAPESEKLRQKAIAARHPEASLQSKPRLQTARAKVAYSGPTAAVAESRRRSPTRTPSSPSSQTGDWVATGHGASSTSNLSARYPRRRQTATPVPPPSPPGSIVPTFHELTQSIRQEKEAKRAKRQVVRARPLLDPVIPPGELEDIPSVVRSPHLDRRKARKPKSAAKQARAEARRARFGDPYNHPGEAREDGSLGTPPIMGLNTMRGGWVGEWTEKVRREQRRIGGGSKDGRADQGAEAAGGTASAAGSMVTEEQIWARLRRNEEIGRENKIPFVSRLAEDRDGSAGRTTAPRRPERPVIAAARPPAATAAATTPATTTARPQGPPSELARRAAEILARPRSGPDGIPSAAERTTGPGISRATLRSARRIELLRRAAELRSGAPGLATADRNHVSM